MRGRSRVVLGIVAVVVVLLLLFFVLIRPRQGELGDVRDETETARNETQALEAELARLEALQENAPQLQAALDRIRELVPRDNQVSSFIFSVQEAATQAGVGFVQITPELPKPPPEGASLAEVRVQIGAGGGYFAVQDFLRRLYSLDRAVRIDVVSMTGVAGEEAVTNGRIDLLLTARVFFELPAGAATTGAATPGATAPQPQPTPNS